MPIYFNSHEIDFTFRNEKLIARWLSDILSAEGVLHDDLTIVMCNDNYLLAINNQFLNKDYYTDIITFQYNHPNEPINGEVYISIDRVRENAIIHEVSFDEELSRVIAHGILHLAGYGDSSESEILEIRRKENHYMGFCPRPLS